MTKQEAQAQKLALGLPAALLAGAYISQYGFDLFPCEMCWLQRWPHFAALGFALLSYFAPPKRMWIAVAAGGILTSGLIGGFHAGVEYDWWEGITACTSPVATGGDALEALLDAPIIRCDMAPWDLFGVSLAGFNAIFSCVGAFAIWSLLAKGKSA